MEGPGTDSDSGGRVGKVKWKGKWPRGRLAEPRERSQLKHEAKLGNDGLELLENSY